MVLNCFLIVFEAMAGALIFSKFFLGLLSHAVE